MRKYWLGFLATLLLLGVGVGAQGDLSVQVLRLLTRDNTWPATNTQTYNGNIKIVSAVPVDTTTHLYNNAGTLMWDGAAIGPPGAVANHHLLSATHDDSAAAAVLRGSVIVGNATPAWAAVPLGTVGMVLRASATDAVWSFDGSLLTALNATQLTSGTIPLARIVNLVDAQVSATAAITWTKLSKAGSSLADLTTRSAGDLSSGTLLDARLSANVSLLGAAIALASEVTGTLPLANGGTGLAAAADDTTLVSTGAAWVAASLPNCVASALGYTVATNLYSCTVLSVAMTVPSILSVAGSPVIGTGTLAVTLANEAANLVFAGPAVGAATTPTFRALVTADFPVTGVVAGTYTKLTVDTSGRATVGATHSYATDGTGVLPLANGGTGLAAAADDTTPVSSGAAWVATALPNCPLGGLGYTVATNLYNCAGLAHNLLSATHSDTTVTAAAQGALVVGNATPAWTALPMGTVGQFVGTDGTNTGWKTYADKLWLSAGTCQNAAVVLDWSTPTANPGVGTCVTGTNTQQLVVAFDNAADRAIQKALYLPATFTGALDVDLVWYSATTAGDVIWRVATICVADGETGDPAFNVASTVTTTVPGTTLQYITSSIAGVTATGCAASHVLYLRISRYYNGADTLNGTANLVGVQLTRRRLIY